MAFATSLPGLFAKIELERANPDLTGAFNIGSKLAQARQENDPSKQFVQGLMQRVQEDAKNEGVRKLFESQGVSVPQQSFGSRLLGGVQDPTEALKVAATIKASQAKLNNIQNGTSVYGINPYTGEVELQARVNKGDIVRNIASAEDRASQYDARGAGANTGEITFAKEASRLIPLARQTLFPSGSPDSFRRDFAIQKDIFGRPLPLSREGQDLYRQIGSALDMRNFMLTGKASTEQERADRTKQFMIDATSNPQAAFDALGDIEGLTNDFLSSIDPRGIYSGQYGVNKTSPVQRTERRNSNLPQFDPSTQRVVKSKITGEIKVVPK